MVPVTCSLVSFGYILPSWKLLFHFKFPLFFACSNRTWVEKWVGVNPNMWFSTGWDPRSRAEQTQSKDFKDWGKRKKFFVNDNEILVVRLYVMSSNRRSETVLSEKGQGEKGYQRCIPHPYWEKGMGGIHQESESNYGNRNCTFSSLILITANQIRRTKRVTKWISD
jgi:hypothetical protein